MQKRHHQWDTHVCSTFDRPVLLRDDMGVFPDPDWGGGGGGGGGAAAVAAQGDAVWKRRDGMSTVRGVDNDGGDAPGRDGGGADGAAPKVAAARPAG